MVRLKHRYKQYESFEYCGGKRKYGGKDQAQHVKEEQELLTPELKLNIYKCLAGCGGWHLTRASNNPETPK